MRCLLLACVLAGCKEPAPPSAVAETPFDLAVAHGIAEQYEGPLDLQWNFDRATARAALKGRFRFVSERAMDESKTVEQEYRGDFAGFSNARIVLDFQSQRLVSVAAELADPDERPASRRWRDLVDRTIESHGTPTKMTPMPGVPSFSESFRRYPNTRNRDAIQRLGTMLDASGATGYGALDRLIRAGEWQPSAAWQFTNKSFIAVVVIAGSPDRYGVRPLRVTWVAMSNPEAFGPRERPKL